MSSVKELLHKNRNRVEGAIGSAITSAAGLVVYLPDHQMIPQSYPDPIAKHVFDVFGAMWAMQFTKTLTNRDDVVGESAVAIMSALGLETLQYLKLSFGGADFLGDGLIAPIVGIALTATVPLIAHLAGRPSRPPLGPDFPFRR